MFGERGGGARGPGSESASSSASGPPGLSASSCRPTLLKMSAPGQSLGSTACRGGPGRVPGVSRRPRGEQCFPRPGYGGCDVGRVVPSRTQRSRACRESASRVAGSQGRGTSRGFARRGPVPLSQTLSCSTMADSARAMRTLASTSGCRRQPSPSLASARSSSSPTLTQFEVFLPSLPGDVIPRYLGQAVDHLARLVRPFPGLTRRLTRIFACQTLIAVPTSRASTTRATMLRPPVPAGELGNRYQRRRRARLDRLVGQVSHHVGREVVGRLVAPAAVLLQGLHHDPVELAADRPVQRRGRRRGWPRRSCSVSPSVLSRVLGLGGSSSRMIRRISSKRRLARASPRRTAWCRSAARRAARPANRRRCGCRRPSRSMLGLLGAHVQRRADELARSR